MSIGETQAAVFQTARHKGWWDECLSGGGSAEPLSEAWYKSVDPVGALDRKLVERTIPEKLALIHSEIVEAHAEYELGNWSTTLSEKGKPLGFATEISDVVIRVLDLAGALDISIEKVLTEPAAHGIPFEPHHSVERFLLKLHDATSATLESYRLGRLGMNNKETAVGASQGVVSVPQGLARIVSLCFQFSSVRRIDLDAEIARKHAYNQTRSFRHGGKRC